MIWFVSMLTAICFLGAVYLKRIKDKQEAELEKLERIFDQIIYGDFDDETVVYEEGQVSKVIFKAKRVAEIAEQGKRAAAEEHRNIQELITDISHQMRTPLSSIMLYTELMQLTSLSKEEAKEFLDRIELSSERLMWLASEFITMTRFETATMLLQQLEQDLNQTVERAAQANQEAAKQRGILICLDFQQENRLSYDSKWTEEAISNVIDNAVKYADKNTKIHITIERLLSYTKIDISNAGIGLPTKTNPLIFQKYYRGENAKEISGAGIGLHLTKMIIEEQGGYILAREAGGKTIISLFLLN